MYMVYFYHIKQKGTYIMIYKFKPYEKTELVRNHLNMGGANPQGEQIDVTNLYFERGGKPWLAVMGEYHFSRASRYDWARELGKMKAGGINIVATYLFWIYHEEIEGEFDFSLDRDIRAFVEECGRAGLDVLIRIGPWAHGECRNGGLPDWILKKPYEVRDNNEEYMSKARIWYEKIYEQLRGLFYKDGGNIIGVQLENELVDNAPHLEALKKLAVEIGYDVPLYTVTGWNSAAGAQIPVDEVVPVFGGYCEAPWENHMNRLEPSLNYFFNKMRNDSAIGTDLIEQKSENGWQLPYERYPFATCELGGGIQVTHHRRPIIKPMDIYALSLVKLGSGNNLIGYYMYHGGTNKIGKLSTLNESKATGYPNDYPILSYDFQAPLSEYGEVREQYGLLNMLHMFAADFGDIIAPMEAVDAEHTVERNDVSSLRYVMRTDGKSGFVFVSHYQRLDRLENVKNAVIDTGSVKFPEIDVCAQTCFFMPFNMRVGSIALEYALSQPLCCDGNTYFFAEIDGIKPEYKFTDGSVFNPEAGLNSAFEYGDVKIVTLTWKQAQYLRKLSCKIYLGHECNLYEFNGEITAAENGDFSYCEWNGKEWEEKTVKRAFRQAAVTLEPAEEPFAPPYGEELNIGGERECSWYKVTADGDEGFAEISYTGDTAQLYADGELAADDYFYGKPWRIPAKLIYGKECYIAVSEMKNDFYKEF